MNDPRVQLFCDESGIDGDSGYIAIGMLWTNRRTRDALRAMVRRVRDQERFFNEIHFTKLSELRLRVYRRLLVETLPHVRYRAIVVRRADVSLHYFSHRWYIALNYFTKQMVGHYVQAGNNAVLYLDFKTREKQDNGLEYLLREVNLQKPAALKAVEILDSKGS